MPYIVINPELCKECELCIKYCPYDCIKIGDEINSKGYRFAVFVNPEKCPGCSLCAIMCPEIAIEVFK